MLVAYSLDEESLNNSQELLSIFKETERIVNRKAIELLPMLLNKLEARQIYCDRHHKWLPLYIKSKLKLHRAKKHAYYLDSFVVGDGRNETERASRNAKLGYDAFIASKAEMKEIQVRYRATPCTCGQIWTPKRHKGICYE